MIERRTLISLYSKRHKSSVEIARHLKCSASTVNYWLHKYRIKKRGVSEAIYIKKNPKGDPFKFCAPKTPREWFLYGLGLGLYWGEGNKANKHSVRLGNTDPDLVRSFLVFLSDMYAIDKKRLHFGLQIFSDTDSRRVLEFWCHTLGLKKTQFQKVVVTQARNTGTYKNKSKHGVLTVYFSNKKLRDTIIGAIEELRKNQKNTPM